MASKDTKKEKTETSKSPATTGMKTTATAPSADDPGPPAKVLTSQQEVIDELRISSYRFTQLLKKYPFSHSGAAGKLNGRWHVALEDVWRWFRYIQRQEMRHPDARRMRPEEPPELSEISTRGCQGK